MVFIQDSVWTGLVAPATKATNSQSSAYLANNNCGALAIVAMHAAATATNSSAKWAAFDVLGGDDTNISNATVVLTGTTNAATTATNQFVLNAHNDTTEPGKVVVHLRKPGLYGKYTFVRYQPPGSTTYQTISIVAASTENLQEPNSASEANATTWVKA